MVKAIFYHKNYLQVAAYITKPELTFLQVNDPYGTGIHNEDPAIVQDTKHVPWDVRVEEAELEAVGAQALGDVKKLVGNVRTALQRRGKQAPEGFAPCPDHHPSTGAMVAEEGPALRAWKHL